ncbi:PAS domain-containing protein [Aetokthonos hydrillicola Thurmond2011]|jgi:methyl-accepting chemotaxis protein PixJ|uniref:PAS domain-containing protein n=1 Tax=Aetokthonos hydrillicola Thurmond2011 TaxID=2712845 RepID=A0AAP5I2Y7_9CYAN|nr:MHYT domain-containing protein [Aetokthonos hydrillicola]MBO3457445.1 PAS domain-containing protein [Aetokthonos hydrillicola CCALA 1050]MBW4586034.1 PAS domain-containing protein [Aetokthonos hydrillicola CCALA 1050]MDR9893740.1 PAS domain-containing protein [Aetokthonos hydrillicola Thurmond2011]
MLPADMAISGTYDLRFVILSIVIAVFASYTALDLAARVTASVAKSKLAWLVGGAIVMGIGIWSMHFVGMLALKLPILVSYDVFTVVMSILPAIVASGGALLLASRPVLKVEQLLLGGVLMGLGIASMHYIGIYAMQMNATIRYEPMLFILSVLLAIAASMAALWIAFQLRLQSGTVVTGYKIISALVMAVGICGMHYIGMASASFTVTQSKAVSALQPNSSLTWLATAVGFAAFIILGFTLLTSFIDQRLTASVERLAKQEVKAKRSEQLTQLMLSIRRSLRLNDVINTTVNEVRYLLNTDRASVYRLNPDRSITTIAESIAQNWIKTLGKTINNPFWVNGLETDKSVFVQVVNSIYEVGFRDFHRHRKILESFQIQGYMVAPLFKNSQLLGLLSVQQCSQTRIWEEDEIELFRQIAIQVGIAIEQASLLDELQQAQKVLQLRDRAIAVASNAIFITDNKQPNNPIIFCNPAFEKITGYSLKEVLKQNYELLIGDDTDQDTLEKIRSAVRDANECQATIKNYRKDKTSFWCELTISPVRDTSGEVINFIGVLVDITQHQQAEQELRHNQQIVEHQLLELIDYVKEASNGDLTVRAEKTTNEIGIFADFINIIIENLHTIATRVKTVVQQVNISVGENSDVVGELTDKALKQASEIRGIFEQIDEMFLSIQEMANNAHQAAQMTLATSDTASLAKAAMDSTVESISNLQHTVTQTVKKVNHLTQSSEEISKVVLLINQLALQTNVLAINASLEGSRTGDGTLTEDAGQLATQSAMVTQEIYEILDKIQLEITVVASAIELSTRQVVEGANLVKNTKQTLEEVLTVASQLDEFVKLISETTVSQAGMSEAIASLIKQIAQDSESTADLSSAVSLSLQQTVEIAQQLQASVDLLKT